MEIFGEFKFNTSTTLGKSPKVHFVGLGKEKRAGPFLDAEVR